MKVFFAAVGDELMENYCNAIKDGEHNLLFSYYELSGNSGFKQRLRNWNNILESIKNDNTGKIKRTPKI